MFDQKTFKHIFTETLSHVDDVVFWLDSSLKLLFANHPHFEQLFNSYYNGIGKPFPRDKRGTLSRPTVSEIMAYRAYVDEAMCALVEMSLCQEDEQSIRQIMQQKRRARGATCPMSLAFRASAPKCCRSRCFGL